MHHAGAAVNRADQLVYQARGDNRRGDFLGAALPWVRAFGEKNSAESRAGPCGTGSVQPGAGSGPDARKRGREAGQHSRASEHVLRALSLWKRRCGVRNRREAEIVVLHVRMLRRGALGEYDLAPDQLFSTIEQLLFTKVLAMAEKEGKPVRLAVAAANDLWEGILRTAMNL